MDDMILHTSISVYLLMAVLHFEIAKLVNIAQLGFQSNLRGGLEGIKVEISGMFGNIGDIFREYPLVMNRN